MRKDQIRRNTQGEIIAMKKRILDECLAGKLKHKNGAGLLQMHPKAFSRLKKRYLQYGEAVLEPQKPGPKKFTPANRIPAREEEIICWLAKHHPHYGPVPLAQELEDKYGIARNSTTVWRVLKRRKVRYYAQYKRWTQEEPTLYCLDTPGQEVQMDACYPFGRSRKVAGFDAIDDCSRWVTGKLYEREDADSAMDFAEYLLKSVPFRVRALRVDNRYGERFKKFCENDLGVEVIENDAYEPKQNGKIERFHKTVKREFFWRYCSFHDSMEYMQCRYNLWQKEYNYNRRHGGYGMNRQTPALKILSTLFYSLNNLPRGDFHRKVTLTLQQYIF